MIRRPESARDFAGDRGRDTQPLHPHTGQGSGRFPDRRYDHRSFRHFHRLADQGRRPVARTHRRYGPRRPRLALPNLLLGALVIVPVWFVLYLFRPPGEIRD
jgi:hypothetical protein